MKWSGYAWAVAATVASTLQRLLLDVSAVGGEREWTPGGTGAVALVIPGVTLSGM